MGNFEILSFGTHQNFVFLADILTPKMHTYMVIFLLLTLKSASCLSLKTVCII